MSNRQLLNQKNPYFSTKNQRGFICREIDATSQEFIELVGSSASKDVAPKDVAPILEIGSGFGFATRELLAKTTRRIIANDMSMEHLTELVNNTDASYRPRLLMHYGTCPRDLDFEPQSLGGILIAQVLHFLTGAEIEEAFKKFFTWLKPKSYLALTVFTVYSEFTQEYKDKFLARVKAGEKWPGELSKQEYLQNAILDFNEEYGDIMPEYTHMLHEDILRRELEKAGFEMVKHQYAWRTPSHSLLHPDALDSEKENLEILAYKP